MEEFPAVAIIGPRQVGKTTLLNQIKQNKNNLYLDLELAGDRQKLTDMETYFAENRNRTIMIDEVQRMPEIFTALRPEIDQLRKPGRFILTGSADPALMKGVSESLAGRIAFQTLSPFSLLEIESTTFNLNHHWFRGGFPDAFLAKTDDSFHRWMQNFIETYIQRDLQQIFNIHLDANIIRNIWSMMAHQQGNLFNSESYARALGITGPTVKKYIRFMEGAFLIRLLQPWYVNNNKRLVKSPKIYIRDSGVLHHLTNINKPNDLFGNIIIGASWEGYVIEEIIKVLPYNINPYFYRTHNGAETDLVLVRGVDPIACIEIKNSKAPKLSDGFFQSIQDLKSKNNYLIYTGTESYRTKNQIKVCGLFDFVKNELPNL